MLSAILHIHLFENDFSLCITIFSHSTLLFSGFLLPIPILKCYFCYVFCRIPEFLLCIGELIVIIPCDFFTVRLPVLAIFVCSLLFGGFFSLSHIELLYAFTILFHLFLLTALYNVERHYPPLHHLKRGRDLQRTIYFYSRFFNIEA